VHRKILRAMLDLNQRSEPIDLITLTEALKMRGDLQEIGGAAFLAELADKVPTAANVGYYARIVHQKSVLRGLIETATDIARQALEGAAMSMSSSTRPSTKFSPSPSARSGPPSFTCATSCSRPWTRSSRCTSARSWSPGADGVRRPRPADGRTPALRLDHRRRPAEHGQDGLCPEHRAVRRHHGKLGVAIFSLEMSKEQLGLRMLCSEARVDQSKVRTGYIPASAFPELAKAASRLSESRIFIDDTPALSVLELRAKARRLKRERNRSSG